MGLGKTIESGIVLAQKWAERERKILLVLPLSLRKQWYQDLQDKFYLPSSLLLETAQCNWVDVMKWFQGTFAGLHTARRKLRGLLVQANWCQMERGWVHGSKVCRNWMHDSFLEQGDIPKEQRAEKRFKRSFPYDVLNKWITCFNIV